MSIRQRKIAAALAAVSIVACFSACGGSTPAATTASNGMNEAVQAVKDEMGEADFNEAANAIKDELGKDTETTEKDAPAEPAGNGAVVPDASEFETEYDAALGGLTVTRYTGDAERIIVPAEINGEPVVAVNCYTYTNRYGEKNTGFSGNAQYVEISEGIKSIGTFTFYER